MPRTATDLVDGWLELWNGALDHATDLVHPDFVLHGALDTGGGIAGPQGLGGWIATFRAPFDPLDFAIEVGPIVQDDLIAVRCEANGVYAGGFPGAHAENGTPIAFSGTDVLRTVDGKFVEYWVNADLLVLMTTLKVSA